VTRRRNLLCTSSRSPFSARPNRRPERSRRRALDVTREPSIDALSRSTLTTPSRSCARPPQGSHNLLPADVGNPVRKSSIVFAPPDSRSALDGTPCARNGCGRSGCPGTGRHDGLGHRSYLLALSARLKAPTIGLTGHDASITRIGTLDLNARLVLFGCCVGIQPSDRSSSLEGRLAWPTPMYRPAATRSALDRCG